MLRAPKFWYRPQGIFSTLSKPLSWAYSGLHAANSMRKRQFHANVPVICVGNFTVGGTGKTPTVIELTRIFQEDFQKTVHILTRGYGRSHSKARQVDSTKQCPKSVGDEPLLLAKKATTWVCADRSQSAVTAINAGAEILLMDDGAQNPNLYKDLCLMVVDGPTGLGNGCVLPSGPLRESVSKGLKRTDAIVLIGQDHHHLEVNFNKPILRAKIHAEADSISSIQGNRLIAFAGIGFPEKFFNTLRLYGGKLIETVPFPDHYPYRLKDLQPLVDAARAKKVPLVTTEKDFVRIPPLLQPFVTPFKIHLKFENPEIILQLIKSSIAL